MNPAPWRRISGSFSLRRIIDRIAGKRSAGGAATPPARATEADELAANQLQYPFPKWALDSCGPRAWIFAGVARGGIGAEVGVFRGHFSEVILSTLVPQKFYMVDPWTLFGEYFPWVVDYTNGGKLPTALARREAQLRAAKFPGTETVIIEGEFPRCIGQILEPLDWIYIDSTHEYQATLEELNAAAGILKPDGMILGDDWSADRSSIHHGVFRAVNEFVKKSPYEIVAAGPRGQWCLRRTDIAAVAAKGQRSIAEKLALNQAKFPFPQRLLEGMRAREEILDFAPAGAVGAEVGAFRGHFSALLLQRRKPRRFYMIDSWAKRGELFPNAGERTNYGLLPTRLARSEAEMRAAIFPVTESVLVDEDFPDWAAGASSERLDWIYLHHAGSYRQSLLQLAAAAGTLKPGGVMIGDGYFPDGTRFQHDILRAVTEFAGAARFDFLALDHVGQWCLRSPAAGS